MRRPPSPAKEPTMTAAKVARPATELGGDDCAPRPRGLGLRCWQCGSSRHVEVANGWRMASRAAVLEWLCGAMLAQFPGQRDFIEQEAQKHYAKMLDQVRGEIAYIRTR